MCNSGLKTLQSRPYGHPPAKTRAPGSRPAAAPCRPVASGLGLAAPGSPTPARYVLFIQLTCRLRLTIPAYQELTVACRWQSQIALHSGAMLPSGIWPGHSGSKLAHTCIECTVRWLICMKASYSSKQHQFFEMSAPRLASSRLACIMQPQMLLGDYLVPDIAWKPEPLHSPTCSYSLIYASSYSSSHPRRHPLTCVSSPLPCGSTPACRCVYAV